MTRNLVSVWGVWYEYIYLQKLETFTDRDNVPVERKRRYARYVTRWIVVWLIG